MRLPFALLTAFMLFAGIGWRSPCSADEKHLLSYYVSLSEEYTDNLDRSDTDKSSEFITLLSPGITYELIGKTYDLNLSYNPSFPFYARNSENNTVRHNLSLGASKQLTERLKLEFSDTFRRTEDPSSPQVFSAVRVEGEEIVPEDTTIRQQRNVYYTNNARIGLTYEFGPQDSLFFDYVYSILENDDPNIQDSERHTPSLGVDYWFMPHWGTFRFSGDSMSTYSAKPAEVERRWFVVDASQLRSSLLSRWRYLATDCSLIGP